VAWLRAADYIRVFAEGKMRPEETVDFRKDCEKLRVKDPSNRNQHGLVDVDQITDKLIIRYRMLLNKGK